MGRRSIKGIFRPVRDEISVVDSPQGYLIPDGTDFIFLSFFTHRMCLRHNKLLHHQLLPPCINPRFHLYHIQAGGEVFDG